MEKYYTPSIEEFHVGFEYEYKSLQDGKWKKGICETGTESREDFTFRDTEKHLDRRRVKHLDREDIESLGWVNGEIYGMGCYLKPDENGKAIIDGYQLVFHSWEYIEIYQESTSDVKFSGTIKNKSELKKLLKQLGI